MSKEEFIDPLDKLLEKHNVESTTPITTPETHDEPEIVETKTTIPSEETTSETNAIDYSEFYEKDDPNALTPEEQAAIDEKEKRKQEYLADKAKRLAEGVMPPRSLDPEFQKQAIGFQGDKIEIVNLMVQRVLADNNIVDGYFPADKKMTVMGELIDEYHRNGEEPTDKFKSIVLENWINPAAVKTTPETVEEPVESVETENVSDGPSQININVPTNTPVTVNVDSTLVGDMNEVRKVEINIVEVERKDVEVHDVIVDADVDSILKEYTPEINTVPITTVYSGYRCMVKPINWFDYLKMSAPNSNNPSDIIYQKWSIIYNHVVAPSIGAFESFEDFLEKTKWDDMDLFEWAIFVATSTDKESISWKCNHQTGGTHKETINGKEEDVPNVCGNEIQHTYDPRSVIRIDDSLVPKYYTDVHNASIGEDAAEVFKKVFYTNQVLTLPDSGYKLEISRPSVAEYINKKIPIIVEFCRENNIRYERFEKYLTSHPAESLHILCGLSVNSITITRGDKDYKFTKWEDIRKLVDNLTNDDIQIIIKVFEKRTFKPLSFEFNNIVCDKCGSKTESLPIESIMELLGFNLSRRLQNTEINLIETVSN